MCFRKSLLLISFLLLVLNGFAQKEKKASVALNLSPIKQLTAEIETLKNDPDLIHGSWGLCVLDVKKDSIVAEYNSEMGLVPASSLKVVTTAAALSILGENYHYETKFQYDGTFDSIKGILHGNLYIKGNGDPTLQSKYFLKEKDSIAISWKWAKLIAAKGIKMIDGSVVADASGFSDDVVPETWIWGDMGNYYGAGAGGLNYRDNLYSVIYQSGNEGDTARISRIWPSMPGLKMYNYVKSGGTKDNAYIYGAPYNTVRIAEGTIPPKRTDYQVDGSMPDPAYYCAYELDSVLRRSGVLVTDKPYTTRDSRLAGKESKKPRKTLFLEFSPRLADIVYWTNRKSVNLYAEAMLKTIALRRKGWAAEGPGTDAVTAFWTGKKVDTKGLYLNDGCGLSRWNSITPHQFVSVLRVVSTESCFKSFYKSLPEYNANVVAKGGYITRVRSYTGYATKKNGELLAFSIIANNYDCNPVEMRKKLEKLMDLIGALD
jgi:D-alanyl-D-alanine carboxypeptidase/D-alanyl-D-alanine-endopeptidase (penicillin-binding protein 4)